MAFSRLRKEAEKEQARRAANRGQVGTPVSTGSRLVQEAAKERGTDAESFLKSRVTRNAINNTTNTPESIRERAIEIAMQMGNLPSASELKSGGRTGADVRSSTRNIEAVQPDEIKGGVQAYKDKGIPADYEGILSEIETAKSEYEKANRMLTQYETSHGISGDYTASQYYSALSSELGRASTRLADLEKAKKNYEIRQEAEKNAGEMSPYISMTDDELNAKIAETKLKINQIGYTYGGGGRNKSDGGRDFTYGGGRNKADSEAHRGAYSELVELEKEQERRQELANYASDVNKDNFWGRAESNFDVGQLNELVNEAYSNYLWNPTPENKAYAEQLAATLEQYQENNAAALDDEGWISKTAAGYLPQLGHQLESGFGGAALGGAAGAAVGSVVPAIGTASGGLWGARAGYVAGTGAYSFNNMRGAAYRELINLGVDEATARAAATDEAVISAIIEMVDAGIDLATLGTAKIASTPLRKVAKALASYGINIGGEGLEEGAQQAVSIANRDRVSSGEYDSTNDMWGRLTGLGFDAAGTAADAITGKNPDARKEITEAGIEGMKIAAMFGGTGLAVNSIVNTKTATETGSQVRSKGGVDFLVDIGRNADTKTESYKIATEILKKQNTGKSVSDTEIGWLYKAISDDGVLNQTENNTAKTEEDAAREAVSEWGDGETYTLEQLARETVAEREEVTQEVAQDDSVALMELARETVAQREKTAQTQATAATENASTRQAAIKKWTGYGDNGVKAFTEAVEQSGADPEVVRKGFQTAYETGLTGIARDKVELINDLQEQAFIAGRMDYTAAKANDAARTTMTAGAASGFDATGAPASVTSTQRMIVDDLAKALGSRVVIGKSMGNAEINSRGDVVIADDFQTSVGGQRVSVVYHAAHELGMHRLMQLAPTEGRAFMNAMYNHLSAGRPGTAATLAESKQSSYAEQDVTLTTDKAIEEVVANNILSLYKDEAAFGEAIRRIANGNDQQAKRGLNKFREILRDIVKKLKEIVAKVTGKEKTEAYQTLKEVEHLREMYENALAAAVEKNKELTAQKNTAQTDGDSQFSLKMVNGKQVVWIENSALTNKQLQNHAAVAEYIAQHIGEVYTIIESGQKVYIGEDLPSEFTHSKYTDSIRKSRPELLRAKNKSTNELGLLIETATNRRWEKTKHTHSKDAKYGMYRYDSSFAFPVKDRNGNVTKVHAYDAELLIRNASDGKKYLYDIVGIKENTTSAIDLQQRETRGAAHKAATRGDVSTDSVAQVEDVVNNDAKNSGKVVSSDNKQYSLKDSEGTTLTKAQQEFFKDSKARDKDGNLQVFYHGTQASGFSVFDPERSDDRTSLFFTSSLHNAASYSGTYDLHATDGGKNGAAANYAVYLNLTNPLIIYAQDENYDNIKFFTQEMKEMEDRAAELERYGYSLDKDDPRRAKAFAESDDIRDELDDMDRWNGDRKDTRYAARWAKQHGYDGVIFHDIVDYAGEMDVPIESATVAVAFKSEQVKSATNQNPTSDPDIQFSLKTPVEQTRNLIALHNLSEEKLLKSIDLGGFPMPSIAVTATDIPHTNFGDITLVMSKTTIDPKFSRKNTVYSADAWTPTFPQIEYEADPAVEKKLSNMYYNLAKTHGYDFVKPMYGYAQYLSDELNRQGGVDGIIDRLLDNTGMMQIYLADSGKEPIADIKRDVVTRLDQHAVERYDYLIDKLGEDVVNDLVTQGNENPMEAKKRWSAEHGEELTAAYRGYLADSGLDADVVENVMEHVKIGEMLREVVGARNYLATGAETVRTETDTAATNEAIRKAVGDGYEAWLRNLFDGAVKDTGIYNNKELYTASGNRRSFKQTHYPVTLDNIAKAMAEQNGGNTKNVSGFYGIKSLRAGTAKRFSSIKEMHDYEGRLKHLTQEEADAITDALSERMHALINAILESKGRANNDYMAYDSVGNMLMEMAELKTKTIDSLDKKSKEWHYQLGNGILADIRDLLFDVAQMPVNIFEAKPERSVRFDEVLAAVLPDDASKKLRDALEAHGVSVLTYKAGDDAARLEAVNSVDGAQFSLKEQNDLLKENAKLKEVNEALREQFKRTTFAQVDKKSLDKFTKQLLKDYQSGADINEIRDALNGVYGYMANGEDGQPAAWNDLQERAYNVAVSILENASTVNDDMYQSYKDLRDRLRNSPISIRSEYNNDIQGYESINDFRKANFGRIKITNDGTPVDIVYAELANTYPEFFDESEYTTQADQLTHIADVLSSLQPYEVNPYSVNMRQAATWLASDIIERFYELPQAKPTFADKQAAKLTKQIGKDAKKLEKLREQKNERIKELIIQNREKVKATTQKEREKRAEAVKKVKDHYKAKERKASESRKARELRAKIMRHAQEMSKKLLRPTDKQHIPQKLQGAVAKLLESINLESNYTYDPNSQSYKKNDDGLPSQRTKAFAELKVLYEGMANELVIDPDLHAWLDEIATMADKRIADMTSEELETVYSALRAVEATVASANKAFAESRWSSIEEAAESIREENKNKRQVTEFKGVKGFGQKLTGLDMMTPETYFHYLGESGDAIFRMMRNAQDKHIALMKSVESFTHKELKDIPVKKWEKELHTVTLGGEKVQLTTAQLMELYVLVKRKQAQDHIFMGGILPESIETKGSKKITRAEPVRGIQIGEVSEAVSLLTDEQKKVAEKLQKYASTELSRWGNEAAMQVYNYEKFNEEIYWPIRSNRQEIASTVEKDTQVTSVAGRGFSKNTKPNANTSVKIGSIFDTFATHSSEMATYAAWLAPAEDINRIRNYTFLNEDGGRVGTVKGIIERVHGSRGTQYLQKLLSDIANGVGAGRGNEARMDKIIGNYKASAIGANLRVIIQQPTALMRALDMIDAKYLPAGKSPISGWKKAKKYAPIAQWKDWGYFDINTGRQMKDVLFETDTVMDKAKQFTMAGAGLADSISWGTLWNAVENEVKATRKNLQPGTDEFYKAVAARFTEIVDHTQVVDGILQRSQIMRSADGLTKMATSFMGEPTKQYNMAMSALYDLRYSDGMARTIARKRFGRTMTALVISGVLNAAAQSIIDAVRDDDDEKEYWEKWLSAFLGLEGDEETIGEKAKAIAFNSNLMNIFNPAGYIPYAKDVVSLFKGYDVSRMDMESIEKTISSWDNLWKAIHGEGNYTIRGAAINLFGEAARLIGIPAANLKREIVSFATMFAQESDNLVMQYRMEKFFNNIQNSSGNALDILYNAYENDSEAYELIYKDMISSGFDAEKLASGMETRMKKAQGVEKVGDLESRYMHPDQQAEYDSKMREIQRSSAWKNANAKQRDKLEDNLYNIVSETKNGLEMLETIQEGAPFGLDEGEYLLYKLALEMVDQPSENGEYGSYTSAEKAEAISTLGLGDSEIAYLWNTDEALDAFGFGIDMDKYITFKGAIGYIKADKDRKGNSISGSRKKKIIAYLKSLGVSYKEYLFLMGTEYDMSDDRDYKKYFG